VVGPLEERIDAMLHHPHIDVREKTSRGGHIVYRFAFTGDVELPDRPYDRGHVAFRHKKITYEMDAWWGLAEFDTTSIDTDLMCDLIADHIRRNDESCAAIVNPGQGHLPMFIARIAGSGIDLIVQTRDAIADAATAHNLAQSGHRGKLVRAVSAAPELRTSDLLPGVPGVIVVKLNNQTRDTTSAAMIRQWFDQFPTATVIAGGPAAYANRVGELLCKQGIETKRKEKKRGFAALRLVRRTR
jgi:hypothetical protein